LKDEADSEAPEPLMILQKVKHGCAFSGVVRTFFEENPQPDF